MAIMPPRAMETDDRPGTLNEDVILHSMDGGITAAGIAIKRLVMIKSITENDML
jgi:hypothetical protein